MKRITTWHETPEGRVLDRQTPVPELPDLVPGQAVTWMHEPRGGYGYQVPVPATVLRAARRRVCIQAPHRDGSQVARWVTPERPRLR